MTIKLLLTALMGFALSGNLAADTTVDIDQFYGDQYIKIKFEKGVQRTPAKEIPISIQPSSNCIWVWVSRKQLRCDLEGASALAPASNYELILKEGLIYADGEKVSSIRHQFSTVRPKVRSVWVERWETPTYPILNAYTNISVEPASLEESLFLKSNKGELIELKTAKSDKESDINELSEYNINTGWILTPKSELKLNRTYELLQTAGIRTPHGKLQSIKKVFDEKFEAYGAFKYLGRSCREGWRDPVKYNEPCTASNSIRLNFNVPVDESSVETCLTSIDEVTDYSVYNRINSEITLSVSKANKDIRLGCLSELKDIFGRQLNRSDIAVNANDFLPKAHNFHAEEVLTVDDPFSLSVHTLNIDNVELEFDFLNYEPTYQHKEIKTTPGKNTVVSTKVSLEDFSDITQVSGRIVYREADSSGPLSIQKSRYNVHLTTSDHELLVFVTDLKSGKPLRNTKFAASIFDGDKQLYNVWLQTNRQGVATTTGEAVKAFKNTPGYRGNKVILRFDDKWRSQVLLTSNHRSKSNISGELAYVRDVYSLYGDAWIWGITDKPIYRPGEVVHYTVYLRELHDKKLVIPELKKESLLYLGGWDYDCYRIDDCNSFYKVNDPKIDEYGTYSGQITLPDTIDDGEYYLSITGPDDFDSLAYFTVANYKPNTVKLSTEIKQESLFDSDRVDIKTMAEYFSGGPYSKGQVEVMMRVEEAGIENELSDFNEYRFDANDCIDCGEARFFSSGKLDENGVALKALPILDSNVRYGTVTVQSSLIGASEEGVVSREVKIPYASRPYFVGVKDSSWSSSSNEPFNIETIVVTPDGKKRNNIDVDFSLQKSTSPWRWEDENEDPIESIRCIQRTNQTCTFMPEVNGYYDILATIVYPDGEKQTSRLKQYFYDDSVNKSDTAEMSIHADKRVYKVGDIADISFSNPFKNATALIVVHRNKKIKHEVLNVTKSLGSYKLAISEDMAPGVDISVNLFPRDLEVLPKDPVQVDFSPSITQRITVTPPKKPKKFDLAVDSDKKKPGESVNITIDNHSDSMKYTIAIIDESIINQVENRDFFDIYSSELSPNKISWENPARYTLSEKLYSSNVMRSMERDRLNREADYGVEAEKIVVTGSRLKRSDIGFSESRPFSLFPKENTPNANLLSLHRPNSMRVKVGDLTISMAQLRTLFKESAYWNPNVIVRAGEEKTIKAELPDNLASWKVIVLGTDLSGDIWTETSTVKTQKSLESRLSMPRQVSVGDQFEGNATVNSRSEETLPKIEVAAEVKAEDKSVLSVAIGTFNFVSPFDEKQVKFRASVPETKSLTVTLLSSAEGAEDGVLSKIPVYGTAIERSQTYYSVLPEQKSLLLEAIPENAHNHAELTLSLSSSMSSQLSGAYEYMQHYPHNCWEQTLSRALVAAYQLNSGHYAEKDESRLRMNINMALNTMLHFQAPNGGMAFFKPDDYNVSQFLSIYTLYAAKKLRLQGYELTPIALEKLQKFIYDELKRGDIEEEMRALLAISLSFYSESKKVAKHHVELAYNSREELSHATKGILLESLAQYEELADESKTLSEEILADTIETNKKLVLEDDKSLDWSYFNFNGKTYCNIISGMTASNISRNITHKFVRTALEYRRDKKGDFGNTISNAICTIAIADYINKYESPSESSEFQFKIQKQALAVGTDNTSKPLMIDTRGNSQLELDRPSGESGYLEATVEYEVDGLSSKSESKGFSIERVYSVFKQGKWVKVTDGSFKRGDWVKVQLKITNPIQRRFVAVTDYVPGGFFPKDKSLATSAPEAIFDKLESSWYFNEKQVGVRTAKFYADILPSGQHQIEYISQATHRGKFSALPTSIEEMYDDDIYGSSNSMKITVE